MYKTPRGKHTVICAITVLLVLAAPLSVTSAAATPYMTDERRQCNWHPWVYEACIEPVGCQTFEEVPETYMINNGVD